MLLSRTIFSECCIIDKPKSNAVDVITSNSVVPNSDLGNKNTDIALSPELTACISCLESLNLSDRGCFFSKNLDKSSIIHLSQSLPVGFPYCFVKQSGHKNLSGFKGS